MTQAISQDQLFDYLQSPDNIHGLDPVAAHGFLCATIVGKPLPNWLSLFFEGNEQAVPDPIKTALQTWRHHLLDTLKNEETLELPFFDDDEVDLSDEGDVVAWCIGFVDAMYANEQSTWFDDVDDEEDVADLTLPMIVLSGLADEDEELCQMRCDEDLLIDLVNALPNNLSELFLLFHSDES